MTGQTFTCEIQARFRDINLGGHVDNVEAIRVVDEARIQFMSYAPLFDDESPGLMRHKPATVVHLLGAQSVNYHAEMRFAPYTPFAMRLWVSNIGRTSFTIATEMRTAVDHAPALIAESVFVLWDRAPESSWPMSEELRADLDAFSGPSLPMRR